MKFSLPSISELLERSLETIQRFPFVILLAICGSVSGIYYADLSYATQDNLEWLSDLIAVSFLGISFLLAINLYTEDREWKKSKSLIASILGIGLLTLYYFGSQNYITNGPLELGYRFFILVLIGHLMVSFSPFLLDKNVDYFWGYNKTMLLNILTSALYSAVLFFGLSIALLSIDNLLGFDIKEERYLQLWIFLVGVFNTFFFLARVPKVGGFEPTVTEYPKALKVFVQYVLIPIVTIYILILYSYLVKILFQWDLPNGWVANLVLSFSIAGIFSLLLLHPIKDETKNNWMLLYSKLYYIGLIPLVILLFISIGTRISEYGVTINRFYVATLAVWLAGIVIYFVFSKSKSIKVIPISLAVIALGVTFGPLSAFSVSERSQEGRMTEILDSNNMLNESGKIIQSEDKVEFKDRAEISSIARYMIDNHDLYSLKSLFEGNLESEIDSLKDGDLDYRTKAEKVVLLMGLEYVNEWEDELTDSLNQNRYFEYTSEPKTGVDVSDYDFSFNGLRFYAGTPEVVLTAGNEDLKLSSNFEEYSFTIKSKDEQEMIQLLLKEKLEYIQKEYQSTSANNRIPVDLMTVKAENGEFSAMMVFQFVSGNAGIDESLNNVQFTLYIKLKE